MNFDIPEDIRLFLEEVDRFIEREIMADSAKKWQRIRYRYNYDAARKQ